MFDSAMQQPSDIVAFATDAIFSTKHLNLTTGPNLGEFTQDTFEGITIVQAGVYWLCKDGSWKEKYRGFDKGTLNRIGVICAWLRKDDYRAQLTRFVGLGSALARTDFSIWRTWDRQEKMLDVRPQGKRVPGLDRQYYDHLCPTLATPNITPDIMSTPYKLAWDDKKGYDEIVEDGIPIGVLEDEYEESFE
jgi:hypothetical protein